MKMKIGSLYGLLFVTLLLVFGSSLVAQEKERHLGLRYTEPTDGDDIFMPKNETSANDGRPAENRSALPVHFPGLVKAYLAWHGFIVPTDGDDIFMPGPGSTWQDCPPYEPLWGVFFP